jgi:hypothetical protein
MVNAKKDFEAVVLNSYEHNGETKWRRTFISNVVPDKEGDGYNVYIPEGISVTGRLRIQPKQEKDEGPGNNF